jgi:hypothetical protein
MTRTKLPAVDHEIHRGVVPSMSKLTMVGANLEQTEFTAGSLTRGHR